MRVNSLKIAKLRFPPALLSAQGPLALLCSLITGNYSV